MKDELEDNEKEMMAIAKILWSLLGIVFLGIAGVVSLVLLFTK